MTTTAQRTTHLRWLKEVTALPTAAGREDRVINWVEQWVNARSNLTLRRDKAGNLIVTQTRRSSARAIFITAHMDHPAFVVRTVRSPREVELEFRGGVQDPYFENARIEIFDAKDRPHRATITALNNTIKPFKRVEARLSRATKSVAPGDIGRWALRDVSRRSIVRKGILYASACDDVAAVAAALAALDVLRNRKTAGNVGVLLTRAEEIGFIGAIAACKLRSVPKRARLICLENSRSFAESPIGAGPIVRVGDKASVFSPQLTNRISAIMTLHQQRHPSFKWQRKLMPGGTCEATTFSSYGYESTCFCLALGNYHNMVDIDGVAAGRRQARVGPEHISVSDYHGLVEMLVVCCTQLDSAKVPTIASRMERLIAQHGSIVGLG
ncbi:MAG: M20/M25/M40 family metallo-hydrolase [Phycisphaerales bacterium]